MSHNNFYDELEHGSPEALRETVLELARKFLSSKKIRKVLDLGCGDGEFTVRLCNSISASEIFGIDISDKAIKISKSKGIKAIKVDLDFEDLPFPPNSFGLVVATEVMEHLRYPDNMLAQAHRVLRPDAYFLLSTPNLASWINRMLILMGYMPYFSESSSRCFAGFLTRSKQNLHPAGTLRLYTLKAVKELLQIYGFNIVKITGSRADYENIALRMVDRVLSKLEASLASHIIILAKPGVPRNS